MKTIRVTGIALSILTLLLAAMTPRASAACSTATSMNGNYAFRLGPAKSFAADLANAGDPANVAGAPRQDLVRAGVFTASAGTITLGHTLATTDTNAGATWKVDFNWTGTYTLNADCTGTLTITPAASAGWVCTDMTLATPAPVTCLGTEEGSETYSIAVSLTNGRVELSETDNNGGGAKIFLAGEALKR